MQARTLANLVEREGEKIQVYVEDKAEHILESHGWSTNGSIKNQEKVSEFVKKEEVTLAQEKVSQMIEELNNGQEKEKHIDLSALCETFEDPSAIKANIAVDDVCCKKQKVSGRKKGTPQTRKTRDGVQHRGSYPK